MIALAQAFCAEPLPTFRGTVDQNSSNPSPLGDIGGSFFLISGSGSEEWHGKGMAFARCALLSFNDLAMPPLRPASALLSLLSLAFLYSFDRRLLVMCVPSSSKKRPISPQTAAHLRPLSRAMRASFLWSLGSFASCRHMVMRISRYAPCSSQDRSSVSAR